MSKSSDRSNDSIEKLLEERSQYEQWLARLSDSGAPESVRTRVRADYEGRLQGVIAQLRTHESAVSEALGRHQTELSELEEREGAALETLAEAEVRHTVGEYDDREWNEISGTSNRKLSEVRSELEKVRGEITRLTEVQGLIRAEPEPAQPAAPAVESLVEPEPEPVVPETPVPAPADPVAFEPPAPAAPAPRFVPRPPGSAPAPKPSGDELDFLKSVAVEQSASLSPSAAEKQQRNPGPQTVSNTTPAPEASPQAGAPGERPATAPPTGGPGAVKTLKCGDCGTLNRPTEWYCERCGAELAAL